MDTRNKRNAPEAEDCTESKRRNTTSEPTLVKQEERSTEAASALLEGLIDQTIKNTVERVIRQSKVVAMEPAIKVVMRNFYSPEHPSALKRRLVAAVKTRVDASAIDVSASHFTAAFRAFEKVVNAKVVDVLADEARDTIRSSLEKALTLPEEA